MVLLLERDILGSGSTGRSSGAVRMHYSNEVHARMAWQSLDIFRNFEDMVGGQCGFVETGYMVFAGEDNLDAFQANVAMQQSVGINTKLISREEAHEIAPAFYVDDCAEDRLRAGLRPCGYIGHSDSLRHQGQGVGRRYPLQTPATGVEVAPSGKVVAVSTAQERIETPIAIVATGPWSRRFLLQHGVDLPLEATRHEVILLKRPLDKIPYHPGGGGHRQHGLLPARKHRFDPAGQRQH